MNGDVEKSRLGRLADPIFLLALALLLLNDHWWKGAFHNFFTGKLSDFAGLYAFAWVWLSLCGQALSMDRVKAGGLWAIALAFAYWKSPWSGSLLAAWNALDLLPLQRVVDFGDWAAIAVLPLQVGDFYVAAIVYRTGLRPWGNCAPWCMEASLHLPFLPFVRRVKMANTHSPNTMILRQALHKLLSSSMI